MQYLKPSLSKKPRRGTTSGHGGRGGSLEAFLAPVCFVPIAYYDFGA